MSRGAGAKACGLDVGHISNDVDTNIESLTAHQGLWNSPYCRGIRAICVATHMFSICRDLATADIAKKAASEL